MKKSSFVITETVLAVVLTATVAAGAVVAFDINKNEILPYSVTENSKQESSKQETSKTESSKQETSKTENSKQEASKDETSKQESSRAETSKLPQISEPKNLSSQPKELTKLIESFNYKYDYMLFDHLIVFDTKGSKATVYCYQKSDKGYWWNIMGNGKALTDKGFIGEGGMDFVIKNGSKQTPMGFYELGDGFYIDDKPDTDYPMFQITNDTYWVDDSKSKFYNTKVEGTDKKDWSSAEHMITAKNTYKYGIVINYNTKPVDKKVGSSIFLCCGNASTEGSVVIPEECMKTVMEWLDKDSDTYIFII